MSDQEKYQGWTNSATFLLNQYMTQECLINDQMVAACKAEHINTESIGAKMKAIAGTVTINRDEDDDENMGCGLIDYRPATRHSNCKNKFRLDSWAEGEINFKEIGMSLASDLGVHIKEAEPFVLGDISAFVAAVQSNLDSGYSENRIRRSIEGYYNSDPGGDQYEYEIPIVDAWCMWKQALDFAKTLPPHEFSHAGQSVMAAASGTVTVKDPDSGDDDELEIFKYPVSGGTMGIDAATYLDQVCDTFYSSFKGHRLTALILITKPLRHA